MKEGITMLRYIPLLMTEKLSKRYGLECKFYDDRDTLKEKLYEHMIKEGFTLSHLLNHLGLPPFIFRFTIEKIIDTADKYCISNKEIDLFCDFLKKYRLSCLFLNGTEKFLLKEGTSSFLSHDDFLSDDKTKLYLELMMRINPKQYSSTYFRFIFDHSRKLKLSQAIDGLGRNIFFDINLKSIIHSSFISTFRDLETILKIKKEAMR